MLGGLDPVQAEGPHRLDQDHQPAMIVGARLGCSPGTSARSASGADANRESRRWIVSSERTWPWTRAGS